VSDNVDRLQSDLNSAIATVRKQVSGKGGEGAENKYGQAYQALVKVGAKPQIRKRYR
jgi:hypothetical protein